MVTKHGKLLDRAMVAAAVVGIAVSLLDMLNVAPGWASKTTPLLLGFVLLYLVVGRSGAEKTHRTVKNLDYAMNRVQKSVQKLQPAPPNKGKPTPANGKKDKKNGKGKEASPQPDPTTYREIKWKGMIFRSQSELKVAKELDRAGAMFISSCKVRLKTETDRQSREVDFLICHDGRWGILEVDGPFHTQANDQWRDARFQEHGIQIIRRYKSSRCYHDPRGVVKDFLTHLERYEVVMVETMPSIAAPAATPTPIPPLQAPKPVKKVKMKPHLPYHKPDGQNRLPQRARPRRLRPERRRPGR